MADLTSIIRVRKWELDQKRRELADIQAMLDHFDRLIAKLDAEFEQEKAAAAASLENAQTFPAFAQGAKYKRERFEEERIKIDLKREAKLEEVREAFQDLKTLEITQQQREEEAAAQLKKRENANYDEVALQGFRRNQQQE